MDIKRVLFVGFFTFFSVLSTNNQVIAKELRSYQLFEKDGDDIDFEDLIEDATDADVVLFGELHNSAICHWLQLELIKSLINEGKMLSIGMEMFESDAQTIIDEYLSDLIPEKNFETEARVWKNYSTDYKPIVKIAKDSNYRLIATNIPRRYAALVARKGFEGLELLNSDGKAFLPELPIRANLELPSYKKLDEMGGGHTSPTMSHMKEAQAVKDVVMAHNILKNIESGKVFVHLNGSFHSDDFEGIYYILKDKNPKLKIISISTVVQDDLNELHTDNMNKADFILVVDSDVTTTH